MKRNAHIAMMACLLAGCSPNHPTTQPTSAYDRQNAAMRDPFNYSPDMSAAQDITGGDIKHYDRNAMNKDLDHVLNP